MARKKNTEPITSSEMKMGDIITAAKSTMKPADYSSGYPPAPGTLANVNFSGTKSRRS